MSRTGGDNGVTPVTQVETLSEPTVSIAQIDDYRPKPPRFPLTPFSKIKLLDGGSYLIKGLIFREALVIVWGAPKCGKTFFVFDMVMHLALGWQYRGRRVAKGTVVYVALEGERGIAARVEAFRRARMGEETGEVPFFLLTTRLDLAGEHSALIADIQAQIEAKTCELLVIDTLNRSLAGSESSDQDMAAYIKGADAIRESLKCTVVVIHHCGHNDSRPRGHTSLAGAADAQISVKRDGEDIVATLELMKDSEAGAEFRSRLKVIDLEIDEEGVPVTSCVIEEITTPSVSAPKRKPLKGVPKLGLEHFHNLIIEKGVPTPRRDPFPMNAKCVTLAEWQKHLIQAGLVNKEGNPREQFKRIRVTLQAAGFIGVWDDLVWNVT